ncbi:class I SAM-dependent methyltransferase [Ramlibacter sp. PS4R-6]|uniref:class I SAM-dependent methyltransferase n=1 Tax=Ramlibacter sp. PS4R-6 TaxID=3133438 RepID=UPI00309B0521
MGIVRKLLDMLRFARYGPTRVTGVEQRVQSLEGVAQDDQVRWSGQQRANDSLQQQLTDANLRIDRLLEQLAQAERRLAETAEDARRDAAALRGQVGGFAAALDRVSAPSQDRPAAVSPSAAGLEEGFYPLLESYFRGSEGDVGQRLAAYREWVDAMPPGRVADLGCGRGEWLALLAQWGRGGVGVDSNAVVAAELRAKGLQVEEADAVRWLQGQPEASFAGVTAFHLVEHLPFGVLLRLLMEAHRVLAPGGSLVLETPNPENVDVATRSFWLDPTHQRPLPVELLELALRYCGFGKPTVLRLHPPPGGGPGRDYALIANKAAAQ